jgi:uncharacterized protein YbaP (TraB family)
MGVLLAMALHPAVLASGTVILHLRTPAGGHACLVGIARLVLEKPSEDAQLLQCERDVRVVLVEAFPTEGKVFSCSWYVRRSGDPSVSDLSPSTRTRLPQCLCSAGYDQAETERFLALHPAAVYRALLYARSLKPAFSLFQNVDVLVSAAALQNGFPVREFEGMDEFYRNDRRLSPQEVESFIQPLCDVVGNADRRAEFKVSALAYVRAMEEARTADDVWKLTRAFHSQALGLPEQASIHDIEQRNAKMADNIEQAVNESRSALVFVGGADLGGPRGILAILKARGVSVQPSK